MTAADRQRADEALDWVRRIHDPSFAGWEGHAAWLEADPRNLAAFDAATLAIEVATTDLAPPARLPASPMPVNDNPAGSRAARRRWPWGAGLGMAVAAGIGAVVAVPTIMPGRAQPVLVQTGAGEQRSITLDGARIVLNGGSRLRLDRADRRVATLERGQAFFSVRHDAGHPFAVQAGGATFQDIGTAFDLVEQAGSTRIAVRDGAVLYNPGGAAVRLEGGQSMRIAENAATVQQIDAAGVGGWRTGRLLYSDAPLTDVVGDVARSIGEPIMVDPALSQRRFSGVVKLDADHPRMFRRMAAVMGVDIRPTQHGWQMVMPGR